MADYLAMDAAEVARHVEALIADFPELADDEALRADMVEGSTELHSVVSRAMRVRTDARAMLNGLKIVKADLLERTSRMLRREEAMSVIIKRLMDAAGVSSLTLPEATLTMSRGRESVGVTDLEALPQGFFVIERKADKDALYKAIKAGSDIPGATIVRATPSLVVRTK